MTIQVFACKISSGNQHSAKFNLVKVEIYLFLLLRGHTLVTQLKGRVDLRVGASYCKSTLSLVWCPQISCIWEWNVFNLTSNLSRSPFLWNHANLWVGAPRGMPTTVTSLLTMGIWIVKINVFNLSLDFI